MTTPLAEPLTVSQWCDALIGTPRADRRAMVIDATGRTHGLAVRRVRCVRHDLTVTFTGAYRHLVDTEDAEDTDTLHRVGDLREATLYEGEAPPPWEIASCSGCKARIIWAHKPSGGRFPVDAEPSDLGSFVLVPAPGLVNPLSADSPPDAIIQPTPESRAAHAGRLHTPHAATCTNPTWRK